MLHRALVHRYRGMVKEYKYVVVICGDLGKTQGNFGAWLERVDAVLRHCPFPATRVDAPKRCGRRAFRTRAGSVPVAAVIAVTSPHVHAWQPAPSSGASAPRVAGVGA
jgi:hypothetical protein